MISHRPASAERLATGLQCVDLSWSYGGPEPVLDQLSFEADLGILEVTGGNGSGKSTLLRLLATVSPLQGGDLYLAGKSVRNAAERKAARRDLGYLPQTTSPLPAIRVFDWVLYGAWLRELPRARRWNAAREACHAVGLESLMRRPLARLSVGQRRRADVARAIVGWPAVCILDEPTAALDDEYADLIVELISAHARRSTVVVAEHGDRWSPVAGQTLRLRSAP